LQEGRSAAKGVSAAASRRHHVMRTSMTPDDVEAILAKVSLLRSMMRPATYGPRSATRQVVEAPLDWLVTVTMVPKGSKRWAHVPAGASYQDAPPVWLLRGGAVVSVVGGAVVGGGGGGEVVVVVGRGCDAALTVVGVVVVVGGGGGGAPPPPSLAAGAGVDSMRPASGRAEG